ncbi:MAG TPA: hypothetical protein VF661_01650 [Actinomycetales bacterium]|jgi:hypothetical protein
MLAHVGYEVLDSGEGASRAGAHATAPVGDVVDLVPPPGPDDVSPGRSTPGRGGAGVAAVLLLAAGALVVVPGRLDDGPRPTPAPSVTARVPPAVPALMSGRATAQPVRPPSGSVEDLSTPVTVAQVRLSYTSLPQQLEAVRRAFDGVSVGVGYAIVPADAPSAGVGTAVRIMFGGLLERDGLATVDRTLQSIRTRDSWEVGSELGTTVDISTPAVPGSACRADVGDGVRLVDVRGIPQALRFLSVRAVDDRAVVRYTGPLLTQAMLDRISAVLAASCRTSVGTVTWTRPAPQG